VVTRGVIPFFWLMLANLALITAFPELVLWLPRMMLGAG